MSSELTCTLDSLGAKPQREPHQLRCGEAHALPLAYCHGYRVPCRPEMLSLAPNHELFQDNALYAFVSPGVVSMGPSWNIPCWPNDLRKGKVSSKWALQSWAMQKPRRSWLDGWDFSVKDAWDFLCMGETTCPRRRWCLRLPSQDCLCQDGM